jgi:signal transduction histidine kinase/HAMP domain-containing protein
MAQIAGNNCTAALDFNDPKAAADTLGALRAKRPIASACVYNRQGGVFAVYQRDAKSTSAAFPPVQPPGREFRGNQLRIFLPITLQGETVGTIYVTCDLYELNDRLERFAAIAMFVLGISLLAAFLLSMRLQRVISGPVLQLAQAVRRVALEKDYSVRATKQSNDELGQLVDGFNEMIGQIQQRDAALQAAQADLEARVAVRTAELASSNSALQTENAERKKAERQLSIEYAMSRILAESSTAEQTAPKLLQGFCEILGWDAGLLWMTDHRTGLLRCAEIWSAPNLQADEFKTRCREMTIARGVGLSGRAWANDRPAWVRDIAGDANFTNAPIATQPGFHSTFAFPISIGNGVGAVVEFFSLAVREQDDALLRTCVTLASQLGQFFERKRAEDHLVQSQKMETVGKLAGGIAHEFNSIMTAIIGYSELLLIDLPPENPLCRNARQIRQAADRAAALTRQLLAYGRKQILQPGILDLNSILAGMENVLRHLVGNNGEVRITPGPGLKAVKADAGQIEQVIVNIAMNAAEAMPNGGTLSLETDNVTLDEAYVSRFPELKAGEYVMLAISDTGVGMSEAVRTRVFEPFFSTKPVGQGTGLGLATCYGILKQSGGHISVYSEPARGSTFKIYLPPVEAPAQIPVQRIDTPDLPRGTETILLVEDDPALREMAATLLTRLGYAVMTAANGVEALSLKQQRGVGHVDLLFTDVVMPHMSGKELSDRVRVLYPHTRILFTSAYTENSIVHQGVLDPGVALLQKPFTPGALARKVREMLDAAPRTADS